MFAIQDGIDIPHELWIYGIDIDLDLFDIRLGGSREGYAYFEDLDTSSEYSINIQDRYCYSDCQIISEEIDP